MKMTLDQAIQLAVQWQQSGRVAEAENIYRQILAQHPDQPDALHLLGLAAHQNGRTDEALNLIRRAIAIKPSAPAYHCNLGEVLATSGQTDEAVAAFQQAIVLRPGYAEAYNNLGNALHGANRRDEAISALLKSISIRSDYAPAHNNLGNALREKGEIEEAIASLRRALAIEPGWAEAHSNLGIALQDAGKIKEAIAEYHRAISLRPDLPEAHNNLGKAMLDTGRAGDAIDSFRRAIAIAPNHARAHYHLGMALLLQGNFELGWAEHEWRLRAPELRPFIQNYPKPRWDGGPLNGRRILLHAEQGLGDAIQFARYVPLVIQRGGKVFLQCQSELARLFKSIDGIEQVITRHDSLPEFDLHCPLMSLPTLFPAIPASIPYLRADSESASRWRERLPIDQRKIGIAWAGRSTHPNDRHRSIPLISMSPIIHAAGNFMVSLQKGSASTAILNDWTSQLSDFADTAALVENLDLIITVDTAIAHLAGAMGKAVWVLLPFAPDWRWMLDREDSPWYPTLRLFRQPRPGDWDMPIKRIVDALDSGAGGGIP